MNLYFVYSSGGGAGDWNGIDRAFSSKMPPYFKDHLLIKFGDIFFNHRSSGELIKPSAWRNISNAREWVKGMTNDPTVLHTPNMIMDVGTSKLVSYLTSYNDTEDVIIDKFNRKLEDERVLEKYSEMILKSDIHHAVTFDIPNLFKVRSQIGNISRNVFDESTTSRKRLESCALYANRIYDGVKGDQSRLLTFVNFNWTEAQLEAYLKLLKYSPRRIAVGGMTDEQTTDLAKLRVLEKVLKLSTLERVHFLGAGGIKKANDIKKVLGNHSSFSADVTTPYNRAIDGGKFNTNQSGYFDYSSKSMYRIKPETKADILRLHSIAVDAGIAYFSKEEMTDIIDGIIAHQSNMTSPHTYECRGKLAMHNFDVFRYSAE